VVWGRKRENSDPNPDRETSMGEVKSAWLSLNIWLIFGLIILLAVIAWATLPANLTKYVRQQRAWHDYCQFEADSFRQSLADCLRLHRWEKQVP